MLCLCLQGGVDCQKLIFLTSDICEREVLQLFLTFCDGKMDRVQFLAFAQRTKLFCKSRLNAAQVNAIFDTHAFKIDSDTICYINYCIFRFKVIPDICEKKNEEVSRVINKLCWIDYSHYTPEAMVLESNARVLPALKEEEGGDAIIQRSISNTASKVSSATEVVRAITNIQRIQRGRQAQKLVEGERALQTTHNSPLSNHMKAAFALIDKGDKDKGANESVASPQSEGASNFSPNAKTPTTTPIPSSKKQLALNRDYSEFDVKRATSREFSLKSTSDYSIRSLLFSPSKKEEAARDTVAEVEVPTRVERAEQQQGQQQQPGPGAAGTSLSLQINLAHILGEYHHRLDYSPYRDGKRSKNDQHKNEILRIAREREKEKEAQQKALSPNVRPTTPTSSSPNKESASKAGTPVRCPLDMPSIDSPQAEAIHCIFTKFAPSGEMTVNDFVKFCYATVLIPFDPPIDFTGSQARFLFRQIIAECFNPDENTYVKGVLFGKRVVFNIFWALLLPGIAQTKGMANKDVVTFLHDHVSDDQLRRIYSSEDGPPLISLLSTQAGMDSDCSSFKSNDANLQVNC